MSDGEPDFFSDGKSHKLILGNSFKSNSHTAFHTVRYDFKPASVDHQQEGELEVGSANEVTVSLPHVQGSKTSCTVYKGSKRPVQKECVLIYDHVTGEFTLERMTSQIQVKKTRDSGNLNFSSHPTLTAPKVPKTLGNKKRSKPASGNKTFSRKSDTSQQKVEDSTQLSNDNLVKTLKSAAEKLDNDKKDGVLSTDESNSSSSSSGSSSSDNDSSSDENAAQEESVKKSVINFDNQLRADLELSESGSDSD